MHETDQLVIREQDDCWLNTLRITELQSLQRDAWNDFVLRYQEDFRRSLRRLFLERGSSFPPAGEDEQDLIFQAMDHFLGKLRKHFRGFISRTSFLAFLQRANVYFVLEYQRQRRARVRWQSLENDAEPPALEESSQASRCELVRECLQKLPPQQLRVIEMYYLSRLNLSRAQIAQRLDISPKAVRLRCEHGLSSLRILVKRSLDSEEGL